MLSNGKPRLNESTDISGAARLAREARDPKAGPSPAQQPGLSSGSAPTGSDETLAKEALEGLKRIRAKARLDKMAIPRAAPVAVRPTVIVARPPAPRPPWVAPLATLAVAVGLIVSVCTGVIAYLAIQPSTTSVATSAEIKNVRETVAQLRRQVSGISENLDGLRTTVDHSSKATNDRFGRFAENLDRIERVGSSTTAKLDKLAQVQPPGAGSSRATVRASRAIHGRNGVSGLWYRSHRLGFAVRTCGVTSESDQGLVGPRDV